MSLSKYSLVRQTERPDCGAAALASIAMHHGIELSLEQARDLTQTDANGSNFFFLLTAAEKIGLSVSATKASYDALLCLPLPAIAHMRSTEALGHFVVLYEVRNDVLVVADPAAGVGFLSRTLFCELWTNHILLMTPEPVPQCCWIGDVKKQAGRGEQLAIHGYKGGDVTE